jgi:tetratricopeptide (TPR) repeat protein
MRIRLLVPIALLLAGCAHTNKTQEVRFDEVLITGDLELEKLNDEELFAAGSSFYAAEDYKQAARYFGRLADFWPNSKHRRLALYNCGLSDEKLEQWEEAFQRFHELADAKGHGDSLDAAFKAAEVLYHLERYDEAIELLDVIGAREDLGLNKRIEARVQSAICTLEAGRSEDAEKILRKVVSDWQDLSDKDQIDDYFPAQAQFFLGEIYRQHYEQVKLDPEKTADQLGKDLEYKAELLLSSQGHYLRAIRIGNGYWATAAGAQIGGLYENLWDHMMNAPIPKDMSGEEGEIYRQELRKKIRVLISKAITVYERTLEAAERIGASNPFVERTKASLQRMKDLLLAEAEAEEKGQPPVAGPKHDGT